MTLEQFFKEVPRAALAFSGGTDSALLLWAAKTYGCDVRAYYVNTVFQPAFELADAQKLAKELEVPMTVVEADVLAVPEAAVNGPRRCYYCKKALFTTLWKRAAEDGYTVLLDGTNASDDAGDRPGMQALRELEVRSPLRECGITKDEVRRMCHQVCVVHHGVSQPMQTTEEFFHYPRTLSACRLMGCPNISPVEHRGDGGAYATAWGLPVQVPQNAAYVAIQPHHIRLADGPGAHRLFCRCTQVDQGPFSVCVSLACADGALQMEVSNSEWQNAQEVWVELLPQCLIPLLEE